MSVRLNKNKVPERILARDRVCSPSGRKGRVLRVREVDAEVRWDDGDTFWIRLAHLALLEEER